MVYTVIIEDRHSDTGVEVFSSEEKALKFAKDIVKEFSRFPDDNREQQIADWLYYCSYGESCSVRVERKFLDSKVSNYE